MLILSRNDVETDLRVSTSEGTEEAIRYRDKFYTLRRIFKTFQEAAVTCRQDLEGGILSIVVREQDAVGVWTLMSDQERVPLAQPSPPRSTLAEGSRQRLVSRV